MQDHSRPAAVGIRAKAQTNTEHQPFLFPPLLQVHPGSPLDHNTNTTNPRKNPNPRVGNLAEFRPEAVLVFSVVLQLEVLPRVLRLVPQFLAIFILAVTADEAQEDVVCDWAGKSERVEEVVAGQEEWEGEVCEGVTEVAEIGQYMVAGSDWDVAVKIKQYECCRDCCF